MDEHTLITFAAAADTILPGSSAVGVHEKVAALFNGAMDGFPIMAAGLLDAFAAEAKPGASFASLSEAERSEVLKTMLADDAADVRDIVDGLSLFTLGQTYSEANPEHRALWARIGYHGPSDGVADFA